MIKHTKKRPKCCHLSAVTWPLIVCTQNRFWDLGNKLGDSISAQWMAIYLKERTAHSWGQTPHLHNSFHFRAADKCLQTRRVSVKSKYFSSFCTECELNQRNRMGEGGRGLGGGAIQLKRKIVEKKAREKTPHITSVVLFFFLSFSPKQLRAWKAKLSVFSCVVKVLSFRRSCMMKVDEMLHSCPMGSYTGLCHPLVVQHQQLIAPAKVASDFR